MSIPGVYVSLLAVAVGAAHVALGYFSLQAAYTYVLRARLAYVELFLTPDMVELQHDRVRLPAVHTGVRLKVLQYPRPYGPTVPALALARQDLSALFGRFMVAALSCPVLGWDTTCHGPRAYQKIVKK